MSRSLTEIKNQKVSPTALATALCQEGGAGVQAAEAMLLGLRGFDYGLKDLLRLKVDPALEEPTNQAKFTDASGNKMSGFDALLMAMNIPLRNDFDNGITLQLASDTFQTFPGTRALFPLVIDEMLRWDYRQDQLESITPIVSQSRSVTGPEILTTIVPDTAADYAIARPIAEGGNIPMNSIRATENTLKFHKFGMGFRTTYEFTRRVRLDVLIPYARRVQREMQIGKVAAAVNTLINGQASMAASPVVAQSSFNGAAGVAATNGRISMPHFLCWLVSRAKAGVPIDTVVGNWDAYVQWLLMFGTPTASNAVVGEQLERMGFRMAGTSLLTGVITFAPASSAVANRLIGFSKADTLEEVVEAGSQIEESQNIIKNQTVEYVQTENSGYRLIFGDTRSTYNFGG